MTAPTVSETLVRVNYSETDQMGVAYHARYLVWLDVARTEHLRRRGASYRELEAAGLRLAVSEVSVRYRQPARYDDLRPDPLLGARARSRAGSSSAMPSSMRTTAACSPRPRWPCWRSTPRWRCAGCPAEVRARAHVPIPDPDRPAGIHHRDTEDTE